MEDTLEKQWVQKDTGTNVKMLKSQVQVLRGTHWLCVFGKVTQTLRTLDSSLEERRPNPQDSVGIE